MKRVQPAASHADVFDDIPRKLLMLHGPSSCHAVVEASSLRTALTAVVGGTVAALRRRRAGALTVLGTTVVLVAVLVRKRGVLGRFSARLRLSLGSRRRGFAGAILVGGLGPDEASSLGASSFR